MRQYVMAGLALLLAACATPQAPSPSMPQALHALDAPWSLHGRIALKTGDKSVSGQLQWQHRGTRDELMLASPLGQGLARLVSDTDGVVLSLPDQPERRAPDAETLTREALGVALPLAGLRYWIEGRPDPARVFEQTTDADGRLAQLRQDGWVIGYLQYMPPPARQPRKLAIAREDMEIRLVIDTWLEQ